MLCRRVKVCLAFGLATSSGTAPCAGFKRKLKRIGAEGILHSLWSPGVSMAYLDHEHNKQKRQNGADVLNFHNKVASKE